MLGDGSLPSPIPVTYIFGIQAGNTQVAGKKKYYDKNLKKVVVESEYLGIKHLTALHSSHIIVHIGNDTTAALFGHA